MSIAIDLCRVPAGTYPIGYTNTRSAPAHTVTLAAFDIATYTVNNTQLAEFMLAGGYNDESLWTEMGWRWRNANNDKLKPSFLNNPRFNHPLQPAVGIGWYDALAFTRWLSRETGETWRLPSEVEWEAAARGILTLATRSANINTSDTGLGHTWSVKQGVVSWCGAVGMLGNVWEWTLSRWGRNWQTLEYPYPYNPDDGREDIEGSYARVMRGGSYFDPFELANCYHRGRFLPGSRGSNIGFRLLREVNA